MKTVFLAATQDGDMVILGLFATLKDANDRVERLSKFEAFECDQTPDYERHVCHIFEIPLGDDTTFMLGDVLPDGWVQHR